MKIKFVKLHENATMPKKAHATDAGFDLTATSRHFDEHGALVYGTGIAVEIPDGYVGYVFPRSSISKIDLAMSNAVGVIDSGYRGEITAKFKPAMLYCDNALTSTKGIGTHATDHTGTVQTDPKTQSVSAHGLDNGFFGEIRQTRNGRAESIVINADGDEMHLSTLDPRIYNVGERIAQLIIMPLPEIEFEEADTLSDGERGANGYGSTGL